VALALALLDSAEPRPPVKTKNSDGWTRQLEQKLIKVLFLILGETSYYIINEKFNLKINFTKLKLIY
jgi:hypothetical protein